MSIRYPGWLLKWVGGFWDPFWAPKPQKTTLFCPKMPVLASSEASKAFKSDHFGHPKPSQALAKPNFMSLCEKTTSFSLLKPFKSQFSCQILVSNTRKTPVFAFSDSFLPIQRLLRHPKRIDRPSRSIPDHFFWTIWAPKPQKRPVFCLKTPVFHFF